MNDKTFQFNYSAKDKAEILKIREKYLPKEADKMAQLRRLDKSVTDKSTVCSLIVGIIGTLILGIGMCCCLVWTKLFLLGIFLGVIGMIAAGLALPVYNHITKTERKKIAPEILRLTEELME